MHDKWRSQMSCERGGEGAHNDDGEVQGSIAVDRVPLMLSYYPSVLQSHGWLEGRAV